MTLRALIDASSVSHSEIARRVGVSRQVLHHWLKRRVPAEHVAAMENATGIPRAIIRPDIFGRSNGRRK